MFTKFKEALGFVADLLAVCLFFLLPPALPGIFSLSLILFLFLFGLVSAAFFLKSPKTLVRRLALASFIFAVAGLLLFLSVLSVRLTAEEPHAIGTIVKQSTRTSQLATLTPPSTLTGQCKVDFEQAANALEIVFAVAPDDRPRVKDLKIVRAESSAREVKGVSREDPKEAAILVTGPTVPGAVTLDFELGLEAGKPADPVRLHIDCRYADKGFWWSVKRWVFQHYS
jgi:hypothetical protein